MKSNEIYLFWADVKDVVSENQLDVFGQPFIETRKRKISQNFRQKRASVLARCLLVYGLKNLGQKIPQEIRFHTNGKPFFESEYPFFSISHSGTLVACSLSSKLHGFDLQEFTSLIKGTESVFLNQEELAIISPTQYWKVWSMKEAVYKGLGAFWHAKLTDFRYESPTIFRHEQGNVAIQEIPITSGFCSFIAHLPDDCTTICIHKVSINQLIK